jgi:sulfite reductase (NADPH) hemoprotein beta-component
LPRKFKLAVTGSAADRAVIRAHDIGIQIVEKDGEIGYKIIVGGGLGRTPMMGKTLAEFLPKADLLPFVEATVNVWNRLGRREQQI